MELPFSLSERGDGTLRYGIALWYRILAAVIFGMLVFALVSDKSPPSVIGWLLLVLSALGVLYEEQWMFGHDAVIHRVGLIVAARRTEVPVSELSGLKIVPFVRGTVPGSADESRENERALYGDANGESHGRKWLSGKKSYLMLILAAKDGSEYAIDRIPAHRREWIVSTARRIAGVLGVSVSE